jgi:triosephosphate isomerase (TIM)
MSQQRIPLIAGNWKLNAGGKDGLELAKGVASAVKSLSGVEVVVSPPFTLLSRVAELIAREAPGKVAVAGQDVYSESSGAFTGEVSAAMLLDAGAQWVIIGHSERRQFFGETDATVRAKTTAAQAAGLRPIVCIGETLQEREAGRTLEVVYRQLDAFAEVIAQKPGFAAIAYEPVWAIGTGKVATTEQAQEVHGALRERLQGTSAALAAATRLLYGGSVKADNAAALLACPDIDGALVGGASLKADGFAAIVRGAIGA